MRQASYHFGAVLLLVVPNMVVLAGIKGKETCSSNIYLCTTWGVTPGDPYIMMLVLIIQCSYAPSIDSLVYPFYRFCSLPLRFKTFSRYSKQHRPPPPLILIFSILMSPAFFHLFMFSSQQMPHSIHHQSMPVLHY